MGFYTTKLYVLTSSEFQGDWSNEGSERVSYPISTRDFQEVDGF